jgi:very-short-patch-repair endonuclease
MNKLERIVADQLDSVGIKYKFQFFISDNRVCKSYDFKLDGLPIILEIDGDFWHGNPNTKNHYDKVDDVKQNDEIKSKMANDRGYKVIRLWERDIKKDPSIVLKSLND